MSSHCSYCSHVVMGTVRICPMCGGTMQQKIEPKQRHCPRCKTQLTVYKFKNFDLDRCDQCEGLWLEPDEFQVLSSEFNVYKDDSLTANFRRKPTPKAEGYLPCACCNKLMTRKNFKAISGIIIDTCISCGIWLDKDELQQIRHFIASGGLNKAQDRILQQQASHIQALDDRISDVELMEKMLNKFNIKRIFFRGF